MAVSKTKPPQVRMARPAWMAGHALMDIGYQCVESGRFPDLARSRGRGADLKGAIPPSHQGPALRIQAAATQMTTPMCIFNGPFGVPWLPVMGLFSHLLAPIRPLAYRPLGQWTIRPLNIIPLDIHVTAHGTP